MGLVAMLTDKLILAWYRLLENRGLIPHFSDLRKLQPEDWWVLLRLLFTLLGTSRVSAAFFADNAVSLMHDFHEAEALDTPEVKIQRAKLLKDIATIHSSEATRLRAKQSRVFFCCTRNVNGSSEPLKVQVSKPRLG